MIRFSEDIDITVDVDNCSNTQRQKRLKNSAKYESLPRTNNKTLETCKRDTITYVYEYDPITSIDAYDRLQRFGRVKVEATSFTVSKPYEPIQISFLIYSEASSAQQKILETEFDIKPFLINTIQLERIFSDKIFAAEFYYVRNELFDTAKHLFDLSVMMELPGIRKMMSDPDMFLEMLSFKRDEERERIGSDLSEKRFSDFCLYASVNEDKNLQTAFREMQEIYVFKQEDMMEFSDMKRKIRDLNCVLVDLDTK
ncbi:MAG: nucleotidyl transferase AbiEii/AbiGii toxin family protein [Bacteroides sp.]|nr:nucleotidyl transferase AbiEii/AbiGii toxin family protein [Eubacterium sp.]MCM1419642.1 nucleotidyl transferase AbiEii/AbiGii toxin family protein [Roseburia sp.]MCM1463604.1 nucleotidyl transferase AbiEii/AbiGii toxin family protein [Bacteroides sp.]